MSIASIAEAYAAAKRRLALGIDPPPRPPDPPEVIARDLANYHRKTRGGRVVLAVGRFDRVGWPDIRGLVGRTLDDDLVVAAVRTSPGDDPAGAEARRRLASWLRFTDYAMLWPGTPAELAAAIGADATIEIPEPPAAEAAR